MTKIKRKFNYKKMAPMYFRQGIPDVSNIQNKGMKRAIQEEIKKRRILQVHHKYRNKSIKSLKKKSLRQLEKMFQKSFHHRKTKKSRFLKKRKTRKLSK
jgi:hypothetical protein|tara:strand:+ start:204 stop:500 length:297 start_codon:yes stop_codon:yes gene_type:complete